MKLKQAVILFFCSVFCSGLFAQKKAEVTPVNADKADRISFQRQIIALKEYAEERSRIPALQKVNKGKVKIKAVIDTISSSDEETDEEVKPKMTGYIRLEAGDNYANIYELTYDRVKKKITAVIPTGDTVENDKATNTTTLKRKDTKKATIKKSDDDDDDDDDKPVKKKDANKDDDN